MEAAGSTPAGGNAKLNSNRTPNVRLAQAMQNILQKNVSGQLTLFSDVTRVVTALEERTMSPREERGLVIAALCKLGKADDAWLVPSQTDFNHVYRVNPAEQ